MNDDLNEREYFRQRRVNTYRRMFSLYMHPVFGIAMIFIGVSVLLYYNFVATDRPSNIVLIYVVLFILYGLITVLYNYLQGNPVAKNDDNYKRLFYDLRSMMKEYLYEFRTPEFSKDLYLQLEEIRHRLKETKIDINFDKNQKEELLKELSISVNKNLSNAFLESVESKYSPSIIKEEHYNKLIRDFENLVTRLLQETKALSRRSNLNLAFGSVLTFIAMGSLAFVVLSSTVNYDSTPSVLSYYIPRLSFIVFIEIFGYFFLKLYKSGLSDIKYYQNELTNVESKLISLKSAIIVNDDESLKNIMCELSRTERNFILKKGESTIDLEKAKLEKLDINKFIDSNRKLFKEFLNKKE